MAIRNYYDENEIIEYDDYAEIILYDKHGVRKNITQISKNKIELVKKYRWSLCSNGYVIDVGKKIYLHRLLTNAPNDMDVDHKNHNTLDNKDCNLKVCAHQKNMTNMKLSIVNTSGVTGVWFDKKNNKWCAEIKRNNKKIWLGRYKTKEEAIQVRKIAEL